MWRAYSDFSLCMGLGLSVGSEHVESDDRQQTMERDVVRRLQFLKIECRVLDHVIVEANMR